MTAVATTSGGVPALYTPPALDIDSSDVQIPAVKFGHPQSEICADNDIKLGVIYTSTSKDDPDPQTLWAPPATGNNPGVLIHVLGMYKSKSMKDGDDFSTWAFNDPDAHPDADTTYNFQLCLPELDTEIPFKMTLSRTKTPAARTIITWIKRTEAMQPGYTLAFRMTTINRKKDGVGSWTVPQIRKVDADPEHVAIAGQMAQMVGDSQPAQSQTRSDEPAI